MYKIKDGYFCSGEIKLRTVGTKIKMSEDWGRKQDNSLEEYNETHLGEYPDYIKYIFKIYGWAINKTVLDCLNYSGEINVLDVGCGISTNFPPYFNVRNKKVNYIGLDPYECNLDRNYLFMNTVLEEVDALLEPESIDVFCFSTSLDHIQDLDLALAKMKKVAKPNSKVVIIQSVRDSFVYANKMMFWHMNHMNDMNFFGIKNKLKFFNRLRLFINNVLKVRREMSLLDYKMMNGIALDDLHFHYFTIKDLTSFVDEKIGPSEVNELILPYQVLLTINELKF